MTYFPWDPSLETGDELIDEQHRSLFALADSLQVALEERRPEADAVANAIYGLTDYVVEHLADEEAMMARAGYPGLSSHHSMHEHLSEETLRLAARYFNGDDVAPDTLAPFVTSWLQDHIRKQDMLFVAYAKATRQAGGAPR